MTERDLAPLARGPAGPRVRSAPRHRAERPRLEARAIVLVGAMLIFAGCHKSGSPRLEGHWRGTRVDGVTPDVQQQANAFATETELDFHGDVVAIKTPQGKQTGKYRVVRDYKKSVVIVTDQDGAKDEQTFAFDDDKTSMQWKVLDGKSISFRKD